MSNDLMRLTIIVLLHTPTAVVLLVCMGVFGCDQFISMSIWRRGTISLAVMKRAASSDSAADDVTNLIICAIVRTGPLNFGKGSFSDRKM